MTAKRMRTLSAALISALVMSALIAGSAQAVWKVGGAPYTGSPLSFSTTGSWTIKQTVGGTTTEFTGCSEKGTGTATQGFGLEESLTLSKCKLAGAPEACVVSPFSMNLTGTIGSLKSKETVRIPLNEACNWFEEIPLNPTVVPTLGTEGKPLSVTSSGTASFQGNWTLTGSSYWTLSGEKEGSTFGAGVPTYSWKQTIGSTGTGNGQFSGLMGRITFDGSGNAWVVDRQNSRVQEFSSSGGYLSQFGSGGTGDGQFISPSGIALDNSGNLLVTDRSRVQRFTTTGKFLAKFGSFGSGAGEPAGGVVVDPAGDAWVADTPNERIDEFSASGELVRTIGSFGTEDGQFQEPYSDALSAAGNLLVMDTHNCRVQEFSLSGTFLKKFGSCGSEPGQFKNAFAINTDPEGNIWVADSGARRVEGFNSKGEFLEQFGSSGTGDTQFGVLTGIAVGPSGKLWISDTGNKRVKVWGF